MCNEVSGICETCADSDNREFGNDCACKTGFIDIGAATCKPCSDHHINCIKCDSSSCLVCSNTDYKPSNCGEC